MSVTSDLPDFITITGSSGMSVVIVSEIIAHISSEIVKVNDIAGLAFETAPQLLDFQRIRVIERGDKALVFNRSTGGLPAVSDSVLLLSVDAKVIVG